jgi:hypothetical protein
LYTYPRAEKFHLPYSAVSTKHRESLSKIGVSKLGTSPVSYPPDPGTHTKLFNQPHYTCTHKEANCPTSSGKSILGYQVGTDDSGAIYLKVSSNDGGGFFSANTPGFLIAVLCAEGLLEPMPKKAAGSPGL